MTSSIRVRREYSHLNEPQYKILAFPLGQELFALLIQSVQKVIPLGKVYGDSQRNGISLTSYQGQELLVIDIEYRIFGESTPTNLSASLNNQDTQKSLTVSKLSKQRYLLIIENNMDELVGLPINSLPLVLTVPESSFIPIPEVYLTQGSLGCLSSLLIQLPEQPPIFLLVPEMLTQLKQIMPST